MAVNTVIFGWAGALLARKSSRKTVGAGRGANSYFREKAEKGPAGRRNVTKGGCEVPAPRRSSSEAHAEDTYVIRLCPQMGSRRYG
jgi:hypothetical protein